MGKGDKNLTFIFPLTINIRGRVEAMKPDYTNILLGFVPQPNLPLMLTGCQKSEKYL